MKLITNKNKPFGVCKNGIRYGNNNVPLINYVVKYSSKKAQYTVGTAMLGYKGTIYIGGSGFKAYKIINKKLVQMTANFTASLRVYGAKSSGVISSTITFVYNSSSGTFSLPQYSFEFLSKSTGESALYQYCSAEICDEFGNYIYTDKDYLIHYNGTNSSSFTSFNTITETKITTVTITALNENIVINNSIDILTLPANLNDNFPEKLYPISSFPITSNKETSVTVAEQLS